MGPFPKAGGEDADLINAGKQTITMLPGSAIFDSALSFGMIRAQTVDLTILGAMDVYELGDIARWKLHGTHVTGMVRAVGLVHSAKHIIEAMKLYNTVGRGRRTPSYSN